MVLSQETAVFPEMAIPGIAEDGLRYIPGIPNMYN